MRKSLFALATSLLFFMNFAHAVQSLAVPVVVSVTTSSSLAIASNSARVYMMIQNSGSQAVIVKFNSVQSGSEGIIIPSGGNYEIENGAINSVYAKTASGSSSITIIQGQ